MDAKLDNLSEISKLLSVKSKMSSDILSLFSKFGFGRLLCRLSLEKHDGISAVQQILSLCLFRINGETIHSIYKKNFYHLLTTGKNCYYRMMVRQAMNWRRLLSYTVLRFECILRKNGIQTESENSCVIFDDTTLEKTGRKFEHITKVFDHVRMNYVLGYKLLLCLFFDGKSSLPFDFSIHEELGKKGDGGLGKKALRSRFSKRRMKESPAYERNQECGMSKMDSAIRMLQRMWKRGIHPHYALADSWFACEKFIEEIRRVGNGAIHYIGLAKMGKTKYFVENKRHNAAELVAMYARRTKCCRKYKCQYIELRGCLGNIPVRIYLIKYGRRQTWNIMLSTDLSISFVRAFELYQIRWNIEVVNKETKGHLGLGSYMGRDFDGQIADATLCYITYIVMSLEKRMSEYETMGELFADMEDDVMALTLWHRVLNCIERLLAALCDVLGFSVSEIGQLIVTDSAMRNNFEIMVQALEDRQQEKLTTVNIF